MRTRGAAYEQSARWFRALAEQVVDTAGGIGRSLPHGVLDGGAVRDVLDEMLGTTIQHSLRIAAELDRLAAESSRRADVCRRYERALASYEGARDAWLATPVVVRSWRCPAMPVPPAPWVPA
jgi:hypothetical protein